MKRAREPASPNSQPEKALGTPPLSETPPPPNDENDADLADTRDVSQEPSPLDDPSLTSRPTQPMKTSRIGMFGGFSVEEKIGEGGMGVVYRGFDPDLQRPIAIKRIHPRLAASKEYAERFLAEARAVAAVIHPNVAQIFSIHAHTNDESPPYFVMEYVEGESAESRVRKRGPVKLMTAVDLTLQAARGLQAAFYKGIVHRDIKPSNLLINLHDEVKLVDFGLARQVSEIGNLTEAGMVLGTPHYVSPEQGRAHRVDHRSDIYSLGCTFYYMLTGTEPFQGASKLDVISAHSESSVPSLQGRIDGYTPAVDELLQRMLAKQPEERFQTYDELIRVLAGLLGTLKEDTRSHRLTASPIILLGLLAVLAALTFDLFRQRTLDSSQQLIQLWGPLYDEVEGKQTLEFDYDNDRRKERLNRLLHYDTSNNPAAPRPSIHGGLHWGESDGVLRFPYMRRFDTLEIYGLRFAGTPDFEITLGCDSFAPQDGLRIFFGVGQKNERVLEFVHSGEVSQPKHVSGDRVDFEIPAGMRCRVLVQRIDHPTNFRFRIAVDVINTDEPTGRTQPQNRFDGVYEIEGLAPIGQITLRAQGNLPDWTVSLERIRLEGELNIGRSYDELIGSWE